MKKLTLNLIVLLLFTSVITKAQTVPERPIQTAVPFLTITPDARAGALGECGAATTADISSIYHNAAKYNFIDSKSGLIISYSPWLSKIANGMMISYLGGFYKINDRQVFSASLKYFSIGEIQFTNQQGQNTTIYNPNEYALDAAYSLKLAEHFSGAIALRFIYSNLSGGATIGTHAGYAAASDLSFYYNKPLTIGDKDATFAWGINFSNLGTKISYGTNMTSFIPMNLKTGVSLKYKFDDYNTLMWTGDINKLMVPTQDSINTENISVVQGIFSSFADAPYGLKEEFHEIMFSTGLEYDYNQRFFIRGGYFYENPNKGDRHYATAGIGLKYNIFNIDFSYLIPIRSQSPLEGTMRFTINFYFGRIQQ